VGGSWRAGHRDCSTWRYGRYRDEHDFTPTGFWYGARGCSLWLTFMIGLALFTSGFWVSVWLSLLGLAIAVASGILFDRRGKREDRFWDDRRRGFH
jgi:hypothetical protein